MKKLLTLSVVSSVLFAASVHAADPAPAAKPVSETKAGLVQLAAWNPAQILPEQRSVHGLRLDFLYGCNQEMYGLDLGLGLNRCRNLAGLEIGGINCVGGDINGVQAGIINYTEFRLNQTGNKITGLQLGVVNAMSDTALRGLQLGVWDSARNINGIQFGAMNCNPASYQVNGIQAGLLFNVNPACNDGVQGIQLALALNYQPESKFNGLQLAAMNMQQDFIGAQVGLINTERDVCGLSLGVIVNHCYYVRGAQAALINWNRGDVYGLQLAAVFNTNQEAHETIMGCQLATFVNHTQEASIYGLQGAAIWNDSTDLYGLQFGLINVTTDTQKGLQVGFVNVAERASGVQIGLLNKTEKLTGIQIGLANFINSSSLPFFPIVNMSF